MDKLRYHAPFTIQDTTSYRPLSRTGIAFTSVGGRRILTVDAQVLEDLTAQAFADMNYLFRRDHLEGLARVLADPESSANDRFVAHELLNNAVIASQRVFPSCQDTGTAIIMGWKGEHVWLNHSYPDPVHPDKEAISRGVYRTYHTNNLRYSQMAPLSLYQEHNTKTNLPAQIKLHAEPGHEYHLLYLAKGGGSANKTFLFQKSRALLKPKPLRAFFTEALGSIGTAACPPYHLAVVIGGLSAEANLDAVKLASTRFYDTLPPTGDGYGGACRCPELEAQLMQIAQELGVGAQFGGKHFIYSARVIRLPRHAASLVIGMGVSCSADRQILAKITPDGSFIENLEADPSQFLPTNQSSPSGIALDLDQPIQDILATLNNYPIGTRFMLSGPLIVARDVAHALITERLEQTGKLPPYFKDYPVYYAGPAKTPAGFASGSFGPTTSQRMDPYVPILQRAGGSLVMLGKGNRSPIVTQSCQQHHGFYLGSIGGPAARLGKECITHKEVLDYSELGMEAVWKITVKNFPAFMITDNKGHDFFAGLGTSPTE